MYRLVIADPPSFSRVSERETWQLIDVLSEFVESLVSLIDPKGGALFLTSHHYETGEFVLENLLLDAAHARKRVLHVESRALRLQETQSGRSLPAGFLTTGIFT